MRLSSIVPGLIIAALTALGATAAHAACERGAAAWFDLSTVPMLQAKPMHPLSGLVYDARAGALLGACPERALGALSDVLRGRLAVGSVPRLIVLGEVHDNAVDHALRAALLRSLFATSAPPRPGLVFEHIRADQLAALQSINERITQGVAVPVAEFFEVLDWQNSGWPQQAMFVPLFAAALELRLPIGAGEPARDVVRAISRQGLAALPSDDLLRARLEVPLSPPLQDALLDELEQSHCGLMPKQRFTNMAVAQRYRDATMAEQLLAAAQSQGAAILFAGNGHARIDRGVPSLFGADGLVATVTSVMLLEVEDGNADPAHYVPRDPNGAAAADFIVFTPRAPREDPCAEMRKQFGKR